MSLLFPAALSALFLVSSLALYYYSPKHRAILLSRLTFGKHRSSARSPSPAEKQTRTSLDDANYRDVFPPSRRHVLADILPAASPAQVEAPPCSPMPWDVPCERLDGSYTTPTGFTVAEVRRLGDFPDYAALSGVPLPQKCEGFDVDRALPRPYRPFRWAYHQTMSLMKLDHDYWLELENTYRARIAQRQRIHAEFPDKVMTTLPGSEMACKELMEMAVQFLCARYPAHFTLTGRTLHNAILGTSTDLSATPPLDVLLANVPEDFALMQRHPATGTYHLRAAMVVSVLGWSVATKAGLALADVHGPVPDYASKMRFSMDRYFARMPTDRPIQRGSWGLEDGEPLFCPPGSAALEHREHRREDLAVGDVHLRVDWQTLRRLPLSGAVCFNFKALFTPIEQFRDEPYVPRLVATLLDGGKENIMAYKGSWHVQHVASPALEAWAREQEENGVTEKGWQPSTLGESPWFPGWEAKWRRQQGF